MRNKTRQGAGSARGVLVLAACAALVLGVAGEAGAQGFVSPSIGFNFGDNVAGCDDIDDCEVRRGSYGVGIGYLGTLFGFEQEVTYSPAFFGESPVSDGGAVTTIMSNLLVALPLGPVRPYGTVGLGAMRTSVTSTWSTRSPSATPGSAGRWAVV
jgi:opacity protein-like surface antigen